MPEPSVLLGLLALIGLSTVAFIALRRPKQPNAQDIVEQVLGARFSPGDLVSTHCPGAKHHTLYGVVMRAPYFRVNKKTNEIAVRIRPDRKSVSASYAKPIVIQEPDGTWVANPRTIIRHTKLKRTKHDK